MKYVTQEGLDEAITELKKKSYAEIEMETAIKWASRAIIASFLNKPHDCDNYLHEAIEHAAFVSPDFLRDIINDVESMIKDQSGVF